MGDGDGWADCDSGHRHWGRHGAAGLLLYHQADEAYVLVQKRSRLSIGGGTWGLLGGARHSHEDAVTAALREASEESTLDPSLVRPHWLDGEHHGGWSYETVIGSVPQRIDVRPRSFETAGVAWVPAAEVAGQPAARKLFPPFAESWARLRRSLNRVVLIVDVANVVGSRADGWWRDRKGAAERLRDELATLNGITGVPGAVADVCFPDIVMVVEGAARGVPSTDRVTVVSAPRSGDDTIAELARPQAPDERRVVVTADRELRARCTAAGASVVGPRWLLDAVRRACPA